MVNLYGQRFAVAELIDAGYASLVSDGGPLNTWNMVNIFRPIPRNSFPYKIYVFYSSNVLVIGPSIPTINLQTGGFNGGIRINRYWSPMPKLSGKVVDDID